MSYVTFCNVDSNNSELACISQHCSLFFSVEITPMNLLLCWNQTGCLVISFYVFKLDYVKIKVSTSLVSFAVKLEASWCNFF